MKIIFLALAILAALFSRVAWGGEISLLSSHENSIEVKTDFDNLQKVWKAIALMDKDKAKSDKILSEMCDKFSRHELTELFRRNFSDVRRIKSDPYISYELLRDFPGVNESLFQSIVSNLRDLKEGKRFSIRRYSHAGGVSWSDPFNIFVSTCMASLKDDEGLAVLLSPEVPYEELQQYAGRSHTGLWITPSGDPGDEYKLNRYPWLAFAYLMFDEATMSSVSAQIEYRMRVAVGLDPNLEVAAQAAPEVSAETNTQANTQREQQLVTSVGYYSPFATDDSLGFYCDQLESHPTVNEYISVSAEIDQIRKRRGSDISIKFDTEDELLKKWIDKKLGANREPQNSKVIGGTPSYPVSVENNFSGILAYCYHKHKGTKYERLYLSGGAHIHGINEKLNQRLRDFPKPERKIDSGGNIVNQPVDWTVWHWIPWGDRSSEPRHATMIEVNIFREWERPTLALLVLLGADDLITNASTTIFQRFEDAIAHDLALTAASEEKAIAAAAAAKKTQEMERIEAQRQQALLAERKNKLSSGELMPQDISDAVLKWGAVDGGDIVSRPPMQGNRSYYRIRGTLESVENRNTASPTFIMREQRISFAGGNVLTIQTDKLFALKAAKSAIIKNEWRINGDFVVVGRFTDIVQRNLVSGATILLPVFEAVYIEEVDSELKQLQQLFQ